MSGSPVVILIHGIRTAASWQSRIASLIETETGATVIPIKYGYFDVVRFLCPFGFCRSGPIERLRQQIEGVANNYKDRPLIVFAHSYGTYALTRVIDQNPYFRFDRVILCGSVVPSSYDWRKVEDQIKGSEKRNAIVNECGTRDIWPVLAQSVTWGYGATGTYGFGTFNVRDRFHDLAHSDFFTNEFAQKYWIPLVRGDAVAFSDHDVKGAGAPGWFNVLRLPLKWVPIAAVLAGILLLLPLTNEAVAQCEQGLTPVGEECMDTSQFATRSDLRQRITILMEHINRALDLKGGELFPLMQDYIDSPNPQSWAAMQGKSVQLLNIIQDGLAFIDDNAAFSVLADGRVMFVSRGEAMEVDPTILGAFRSIKGGFQQRSTIVEQIKAADMPPADTVTRWMTELEEKHTVLRAALGPLVDMLATI